MASGWSCQHMGTNGEIKEWCLKLSHKCDPGCKGCIIYNQVTFTTLDISEEQERKVKNRSDNPLKNR